MEAHIFCGPEFVLLVPKEKQEVVLEGYDPLSENHNTISSSTSPSIKEEVLLEIQTSLFPLCTPQLKRRLELFHGRNIRQETSQDNTGSSSGSGGTLRSCLEETIQFYAQHNVVQLYHSLRQPTGVTSLVSQYFGPSKGPSPSSQWEGTVPKAPTVLRWLQNHRAPLSTEEQNSVILSKETALRESGETAVEYVAVLFYITDSRLASELYEVALRGKQIAVSHDCLVLPYVRSTARATRLSLEEILEKRMQVRRRANLDADLYQAMQEELREQKLAHQVLTDYDHHFGIDTNKVRSQKEERERVWRAVVYYTETQVHYVGTLRNDGGPSPFLLALGLCLYYRLTEEELLAHWVKHPRRTVRAVALFYLRHALGAPEELFPFFLPSTKDEVRLSVTEDGEVTSTMREIAQDLLLKEEVGEAFLPTYHSYWRHCKVEPLWSLLNAYWEVIASGGGRQDLVEEGGEEQLEDETKNESKEMTGAGSATTQSKGPNRGLAATFGVRSLKDIDALLRSSLQKRNRLHPGEEGGGGGLVPLSVSTLVARRHQRDSASHLLLGIAEKRKREDGDAVKEEDSDVDTEGSRSDNDDFLIDVVVEGDEKREPTTTTTATPAAPRGNTNSAVSSVPPLAKKGSTAATAVVVEAPPPEDYLAAVDAAQVAEIHRSARAEGYKAVLRLLGRTKPFDRRNECYLEF